MLDSLHTKQVILGNEIVDNEWTIIEDAEFSIENIVDGQKTILPVSIWLANKETLSSNNQIGVWLNSDEEASLIGDDCKSLPVICINFPAFADGRGYSYARQLRDTYGFEGELRAIGDVLKDQLFFYARCGFNSYAMREDRDLNDALTSLNDFSQVYQGAADNKAPGFLRT